VLWIPPSPPSPRNTTAIRKFAENVTLLYHLKPLTAERESADTAISSDSRRNPRIDHLTYYLNLNFHKIKEPNLLKC